MPRPIFFSFASSDAEKAAAIAGRFSGDTIYCYTQSGEEGADFWDEVERRELGNARGLVIFWSRHFVASVACRRELKLASDLLKSGSLRQAVILCLDDTPIVPMAGTPDAAQLEIYDHLAPFTQRFRATALPYDAGRAFQTVDRMVRDVTVVAMPIFPRPQMVEAMRSGARAGEFSYRPAVWVSGLNGYGRRTIIREFYRTLNANAVAVELDITELALPLPLLLMIEERALGADRERLERVQAELADAAIAIVAARLADAINSVATQGRYLILRQVRVHEERAVPPEWIATVIKLLSVQNAPLLFLTVQVPPPDPLVIDCANKLGTMRMTSLSLLDAENFVRATITAVGNKNLSWNADIVERIIKGANGNPELIAKIVGLASLLPSLENLDAVIGSETAEFAATMTRLAQWAFAQLTNDDERRALLVLDNLTLASADDIAAFLASDRPMTDILGSLERVGLVERDDGDLYRLSPMLSNRLNASLVTPELTKWRNEAVRRFIASPIEIDAAGHGMVSVQARINAAMQSGAEVPEAARKFVSAANYLQSGIRAYRASRIDVAHKLLREAFNGRETFMDIARREAARFYGLACARQGDDAGVDAALVVLDGHYLSKPVAYFIRGFRSELKREYGDAIDHYEKSRKADEDLKQTYREAITIRYLVSCILRTNQPNFDRATRLVDRAVKLNSTAFVLMIRARTYLQRHFKGNFNNQQQLDDSWYDYEDALKDLETYPGAADFYFQVRAEEAMLDGKPDDAIDWMRQALGKSGRFDHQLRLWQYMARSAKTQNRVAMMKDIEGIANTSAGPSVSVRERQKMIDFYAKALSANGPFGKFQLDQVFPQDASGHNLSAHSKFGKNPSADAFTGDDVSDN
jgi:tetratricopeptide (TPR) repeat protein